MPPYSYREMVKEAKASLNVSGGETRPAMLLLEDLFGMGTADFLLDGDREVPPSEQDRYKRALARIINGEPYQYVVGSAWFYGEKFKVSKETLIPRNETEELVELVLELEQDDGRKVVDIGCGTGVIGLTLAAAWHDNEVILTDVSGAALEITKENARTLGVVPKIMQGSLFEPLMAKSMKVDCVISNPPYIGYNEMDDMGDSVINHEPALALFAEDEGLGLYKSMIDQLEHVLHPGGMVYFEIGWKQGAALADYATARWPKVMPQVKKDMNGNDRILYFRWEV
ncbi:peptide chain release factor N(5)-glutamine methyltransferase [Salinicoccus luteus]|uniref:peptide chain release factor N(5)-glutamine methyltransferase n=1 Tax=Salinicoccus luteus TaxID=367840 RepID=UPI0004E12F61|nr:peptide chain release factor N(5)-glutamine methyltransferase [Salinicoccus luteus]